MDAVAVLRNSAELAFQELLESLADVDEPRSWAVVEPVEGEYLHTAGSILAIVHHIASCKYGYGICAFGNMDVRGREVFERTKTIGTNWQQSKAFLQDSQDYWMRGWADLRSEQLEEDRGTIWGKPWPTWKLISRVIQHDAYHAGQINLIRSIRAPADTPPDMRFDLEEKYARESADW
ncbi:MAG: hypothetical protein QOJ65_1424 [Fimbriimonadaceae bacterium]|jgi:uncharacterized damage-inducible protein DinB|nr:hypothetical protein [Fimbriimonadaceae bacterium]